MNKNDTIFLQGKEKLSLDEFAIYDRIINVKIIVQDRDSKDAHKADDVFIIRSDYEVYYPTQNVASFADGITPKTFGIRKCVYKPSIKLDYKMLTSSVGGSIDLYISNFYILTSDGKSLRNFNASKYKILRVEITMGYFGQFKNTINTKEINPEKLFNQLFDFTPRNGADSLVLTGDSIVVTTDKLPPDYTLHIHGYVGNILESTDGKSSVKTSAESEIFTSIKSSNPKSINNILFEEITRRFFNNKYVKGSAKLRDKIYTATNISTMFDTEIIFDESGKMSEPDALKYGIKVVTSKGVDKINFEPAVSSDDTNETFTAYFVTGATVGKTLNRILSYVSSDLLYTTTNDGTILVYTKEEALNTDDLTKQWEAQKVYSSTVSDKMYNNKLPAVYNINTDALTTIVCPFFTFIEPFQQLEFKTAYTITDKANFYASYDNSIYLFNVIRSTVSFATVDDINEVTIIASNTKEIGLNA